MQFLTDYLLGKFFKQLLFLSLFFSLLLLFFQIFNISHLLFSLPPKRIFLYSVLWFVYTYLLAVAVSVPLVVGNLIFTLKEERFFHILYSFGFSEKKVFLRLWLAVFIVTLFGIFSSLSVNYQKISYLTKYLKYQFGERILLSIPEKSFFNGPQFSVYFDKRDNNRFEHIVVKTEEEIATAQKGELTENGILVLEHFSLFTERNNGYIFAKGEKYEVSLLGGFHGELSRKKLIKNWSFLVALFVFPLIFFPYMFRTFFVKTDTRFKTFLTALGFVIVQFILALVVKSIV